MDKSLSETLALARRWEKKAAKVNGIVLTDSSELVIKFAGHISVRDEGIVLTSGDFEFRLVTVTTMSFMYEDAALEIRDWDTVACCMSRKPKQLHERLRYFSLQADGPKSTLAYNYTLSGELK